MEQLVSLKTSSLSFNRAKGKFVLSLGDEKIEQNVCEFLQTMSFLVGRDLNVHIQNLDAEYDHIRLPLTNTGKTATLTLIEFIRLHEAYGYQMFLLKLEDVLMHKRIQLPKLF